MGANRVRQYSGKRATEKKYDLPKRICHSGGLGGVYTFVGHSRKLEQIKLEMKAKNLWLTLTLINLCGVALLGMTLRTKLLFTVRFIDFKNFLSAHSHFAFGGWVTLALMLLYIANLLNREQQQRSIYQWILWGIELNALGMAVTFPFQGYALLSIVFSTLFIFFTYAFSWTFFKDLRKTSVEPLVKLVANAALSFLVISSIGPFTLAYILATKTGNAILYRDSIYTYLHFQYNGFFTLSVFALFFNQLFVNIDLVTKKKIRPFVIFLCLSIVPSLFLALLWHAYNIYIRGLAIIGCALTIITLVYFSRFAFRKTMYSIYTLSIARALLVLSMISFAIKMLLQIGTIIPSLGNAVFGYRPIIIGFLHLVFLGLVTFYILSNFVSDNVFPFARVISKTAIIFFSLAIITNETILLVDGIGLMFNTTSPVYPWLLWIASILLFTGTCLILAARLAHFNVRPVNRIAV